MKRVRPVEHIQNDLRTALAFQERYSTRQAHDPLAQQIREQNEQEIATLQTELAQALSGDLEVTLDGTPVEDHRVTVSYLNRVLETLQASYRAVFKELVPEKKLKRGEAMLSVAGTGPGSFKVALAAPATQLEFLDQPLGERALAVIFELMEAAANKNAQSVAPEWASRSDESAVRAMIRLSASLAGSKGATHLRWRSITGTERIVSLRADDARSLAVALAGEAGREILTITGHLTMGQDQPPRVKIKTIDDDYSAEVRNSEMLERVKELLFEEVRATLVIDVHTSPSTGSPDTDIELLDLEPA